MEYGYSLWVYSIISNRLKVKLMNVKRVRGVRGFLSCRGRFTQNRFLCGNRFAKTWTLTLSSNSTNPCKDGSGPKSCRRQTPNINNRFRNIRKQRVHDIHLLVTSESEVGKRGKQRNDSNKHWSGLLYRGSSSRQNGGWQQPDDQHSSRPRIGAETRQRFQAIHQRSGHCYKRVVATLYSGSSKSCVHWSRMWDGREFGREWRWKGVDPGRSHHQNCCWTPHGLYMNRYIRYYHESYTVNS